MDELNTLAERSRRTAPHLRAVAYRMLGSRAEAEDARAGGVDPARAAPTPATSRTSAAG